MTEDDYLNFQKYRGPVYEKFGSHHGGAWLAELLGYLSEWEMHTGFCEKDKELCIKLAGPHGHTIYKALLARKKALPVL